MARNSKLLVVSILSLCLFVLPFVFVSKYVIPNTDDLCRAAFPLQEYFSRVGDWYLSHNGRFMNAFFALLPVYNINLYRIILALQFPIFGYIIYRFFSSVFKSYSIKINSYENLFISVIFFILILASIPSVYDFFYWYAAVTVYLFSFYFLLIFIQECLKIHFSGKMNFFLLAIIVILIIGSNELLLAVINLSLILLTISHYLKRKKWNRSLILLSIISLSLSLVVVLSPGTLSRRAQFDFGGNLYGSFKVALKYGVKFPLESLLNFPLILFCIFIFFLIYKKTSLSGQTRFIPPLTLLIISYLSLCTVFFILFYATGLLEIYSGRIANFVICITLIFIILNVVNLAIFTRFKFDANILNFKSYFFCLIVILFLAVVGVNSPNYIGLRKDFLGGDLVRFNNEFQSRSQQIEANQDEILVLKKIENTNVLRSGDNGLINDEWVKDCYIRFLKRTDHRKVNNIYIKQ